MRGPSRQDWTWIAVVALVVGIAALGGPEDDGPPLDPTSTGPLGTRALVLLLDEAGVDVDVTDEVPRSPRDGDVVLVLADALDERGTTELESWVDDGGTLVVADPGSSLVPAAPAGPEGGLAEATAEPELLPPDCDLPALGSVDEIDHSGGVGFRDSDALGCFPLDDRRHFLVAASRRRGAVIALGGAGLWVNEVIGRADNAALAIALMAPEEGGRVVLLRPPTPGGGSTGIGALISSNVKQSLWQLLLAFGVLAFWRARRLGRPVVEEQPVQLSGSELVLAVGNLLQHAKSRDQAASVLRADLRRQLAGLLGLSPLAPAERLAEATAARTGLDAGRVHAALADAPVFTEEQLIDVAQRVDALRQEVSHVP